MKRCYFKLTNTEYLLLRKTIQQIIKIKNANIFHPKNIFK